MKHVRLSGCAPVPLAHYLKALGILRLVAESEHGDASAAAYWKGDNFMLNSRFDRGTLTEFFLSSDQPTPIVAPWIGGSGFYEGDEQSAVDAIRQTSAPRLPAITPAGNRSIPRSSLRAGTLRAFRVAPALQPFR